MAISIGDALAQVMASNGWNRMMQDIKLRKDWEIIVGHTVAKYTKSVQLRDYNLIITTEIAALKQELQYGKQEIINKVNQHFGSIVVKKITIY